MYFTEVIRLRVRCDINFHWFPFDVHTCEIYFHSDYSLQMVDVQFEEAYFESELVVPLWKVVQMRYMSKLLEDSGNSFQKEEEEEEEQAGSTEMNENVGG